MTQYQQTCRLRWIRRENLMTDQNPQDPRRSDRDAPPVLDYRSPSKRTDPTAGDRWLDLILNVLFGSWLLWLILGIGLLSLLQRCE
jgi:hypothetical protein